MISAFILEKSILFSQIEEERIFLHVTTFPRTRVFDSLKQKKNSEEKNIPL